MKYNNLKHATFPPLEAKVECRHVVQPGMNPETESGGVLGIYLPKSGGAYHHEVVIR